MTTTITQPELVTVVPVSDAATDREMILTELGTALRDPRDAKPNRPKLVPARRPRINLGLFFMD